jgi:flagellum-specific peptidoglycan hydrolase FlgJ
VHSVRRPWWQQATALVTVSTGGAISGFTFVPGAAATVTSPSNVPVHLLALEKAAKPADTGDARLRSAIVNVASYYLRLAQTRTPGQMEALIWGDDSLDGADHGASCAAFASLTLELAAQATGEQSWVTGGSTYPWPLHEWVDARVDENPDSPGITSIVQDAEAHQRWHPLGDGYQPQPGDWVLFDQHVEVVTGYTNGVLSTIGADSLPNLTVNAHSFPDPLAAQGVEGFVDNGHLDAQATPAGGAQQHAPSATGKHAAPATTGARGAQGPGPAARETLADIPGAVAPAAGTAPGSAPGTGTGPAQATQPAGQATSTTPAAAPAKTADPTTDPVSPTTATGSAAGGGSARSGESSAAADATADIPGDAAPGGLVPGSAGTATAPARAKGPAAHASPAPYSKHTAPDTATPGTSTQQAFINQVAPGAFAAQQRFGVPASVTIAQAIDESGWGTSQLAAVDNNLFGIKGTGPAGSITLPTQEFENGQWVTIYAQFRVYHNVSESISDHAELLATSGYYQRAMADRAVPDAFANDLTGVYATDPDYGSNLIAIMRLYNLYRFDAPPAQAQQAPTASSAPTAGATQAQPSGQSPSGHPADSQPSIPGVVPAPSPAPAATRPAATAPATRTAPATPTAPGARAAPTTHTAPAAAASGTAAVPGSVTIPGGAALRASAAPAKTAAAPGRARSTAGRAARGSALVPGLVTPATPRYQAALPATVATAYFAKAKAPLARAEQLHRDVAGQAGIPWQLLAACDWMECHADPRYSPVQGERLGTLTSDGSVYPTKSEALAQVAGDLRELAMAVYGLDLTAPGILSVRAIADVFAAFRWGGLLRRHRVSAMEFPYSVAGLTVQHQKMHWPLINDPDAPDRPGSRFRMPFGAVPVVLTLNYPATV